MIQYFRSSNDIDALMTAVTLNFCRFAYRTPGIKVVGFEPFTGFILTPQETSPKGSIISNTTDIFKAFLKLWVSLARFINTPFVRETKD